MTTQLCVVVHGITARGGKRLEKSHNLYARRVSPAKNRAGTIVLARKQKSVGSTAATDYQRSGDALRDIKIGIAAE